MSGERHFDKITELVPRLSDREIRQALALIATQPKRHWATYAGALGLDGRPVNLRNKGHR